VKRRAAAALAAVALACLLGAALARPAQAQCAMCRTTLTASAEGRAMSSSFNRAILLMLFAPYLVVGATVLVLFRRPLAAHLSRRFGRTPR
jgi:hypothetical protein